MKRADQAYREIEERIIMLQLAPGAALSEGALVEALGIGRTPVREALQKLEREGLVEIRPRRGVAVSNICVVSQLELLVVRRELERLMARLAAKRSTAEERKDFERIGAGMRAAAKSKDAVTFMRFDRELNLAIAEACRNSYAKGAMELTHGLSRRFWYANQEGVLDLPLCARLHADLAEAVSSGRQAAAAAASNKLMDYIEEFTRKAQERVTRS